ncbi:biotin carboxylase N-terminal domain-containing protein [Ottowia sp.]|uniref:acetyl/propionyl/methylcrotonyl-CoA carboxylase subunit alpha n=1 Tax=Ottowia sp. TaxID=1898956 RepID=UPI002CB6E772|nr:biotin carboxylase N-terminal domain-containing protein [Ottowia sp.]MCZ2088659.1 ATP-grasp domain-containing protein [Burkholderiales bacterium]HNR84471.1 biotin carboxylase N-terminal domain-containing protein [Ottowia sp.]HNT85876.1 biotin carboxylase N-terminal domain-containing protein [Ottowia sp.]
MAKVLIANRGEVAVRIARACRDYGVRSVAVYADPDADALHVRAADEAWALPGTRPADTYLAIDRLLAVARQSGADAVHPGYGFLSERAEFARAVLAAGLTWIGPRPETIEALGDKVAARRIALQVGAPLVAGTAEPVGSADEVLAFARRHGLPLAIKAAYGGGGRGLKVAWQMDEVVELYASAVREATAAFGRGECFLEQFLDRPRHIEAQVIADRHGHVVVLGTRDCSLQRRHQKLVEEAPAPFLSDAQRAQVHQAARDICAAAGYESAGTVEFLLGQSGQISFLEVNTRLQVEHPVTEETSGVDLVLEQLRVADGLPLSFTQAPPVRGHSFEFRLNAEDPGRGYLPTPGRITRFDLPAGPGVRVDTGFAAGSTVPGSFDSLLAKLIVTGATRAQALARARRALAECRIEGVASVLPFHRAVVDDPAFVGADGLQVHTRWIETELQASFEPAPRADGPDHAPLLRSFIEVDGRRLSLGLPAGLALGVGAAAAPAAPPSAAPTAEAGDVLAPLTGSLVRWHRQTGEPVAAGEAIATLEAMKMETVVSAPCAGTLECLAAPGDMLTAGQRLARVRG